MREPRSQDWSQTPAQSGAPWWCRASLVVTLASAAAGAFAGATIWPTVALPKDAMSFVIGDQITMSGLPIRMTGFVIKEEPSRVATWFRQHLDQPLVENRLGRSLVLGRAQGDYFISVQLSPSRDGTTGLLAVSDLKSAYGNRLVMRAEIERLLSRFPVGSTLSTNIVSVDDDKRSRQYVVSNFSHQDVNRERLTDLMRDEGMSLYTRAVAGTSSGRLPSGPVFGETLFFRGRGKEAMAVISRDGAGRTVVQVNEITVLGHF